MVDAAASFPAAPPIDTERLHLRSLRASDFAGSFAMWSDPDVVRFIGGEPLEREAVWKHMLQLAGMWSLFGYGSWAVEEKSSGRYIGDVGFVSLRRDLEPSFDGMLELGWVLAPAAHGKGYASEAVAAVCTWGERYFPNRRMVCITAPENRSSIRVAEKAGFSTWQETTYHGKPTIVFRR